MTRLHYSLGGVWSVFGLIVAGLLAVIFTIIWIFGGSPVWYAFSMAIVAGVALPAKSDRFRVSRKVSASERALSRGCVLERSFCFEAIEKSRGRSIARATRPRPSAPSTRQLRTQPSRVTRSAPARSLHLR